MCIDSIRVMAERMCMCACTQIAAARHGLRRRRRLLDSAKKRGAGLGGSPPRREQLSAVRFHEAKVLLGIKREESCYA